MNIWVDIDNAPHVLVLGPLIRHFRAAGHNVEITAREFGQTLGLLDLHGLQYHRFGRHAGRRKVKKVVELLGRSAALAAFARRQRFDLVFSHGARGTVLPSLLLGIPLIYLTDYENSFVTPFRLSARRTIVPDVISDEDLARRGFDLRRVVKYPGLKEELYVYDFQPDAQEIEGLGIDSDKPLVVLRPPATEAHYHVRETDHLFEAVLGFLRGNDSIGVVALPRSAAQRAQIREALPSAILPDRPVHGPNLLWHADVVIGAGGTINREAACLGVPVYTAFRGQLGGVDRHLIAEGRLRPLQRLADVQRISLTKRERPQLPERKRRSAELVEYISERILEVVGT